MKKILFVLLCVLILLAAFFLVKLLLFPGDLSGAEKNESVSQAPAVTDQIESPSGAEVADPLPEETPEPTAEPEAESEQPVVDDPNTPVEEIPEMYVGDEYVIELEDNQGIDGV